MAEVAATTPSGYRVVSTFSGCGGTSIGLRLAGFSIAWASEFIEVARESYLLNASPSTVVDSRDIRTVTGADIKASLGLTEDDEIDLLEGSPPCAAFSRSGKREKLWGQVREYSGVKQRVDDLFSEYTRLVRELQPRVFVAENVPGLIDGKAKGWFKEIIRDLTACGYRIEARLLDASWLGVPQKRVRLIIIGIRNDRKAQHVWPTPQPYRYTLEDAVATCVGSPIEPEAFIERYAIGKRASVLAPGEQDRVRFNLAKARFDRAINTITAGAANPSAAGIVHPSEPRKFSVAEYRALFSFPPDFRFAGGYELSAERMGRAVPPLMAYQVGLCLRRMLDAG